MSDSQSINHTLVIEEPEFQQTISLEENTYSIGRHSSNSIVLLSRMVSRYHATLLRVKYSNEQRDTFWVIDGNLQGKRSANGIFVNEKQCLSHELQSGDVITFGGKVKATYLTNNLSNNGQPTPNKSSEPVREISKAKEQDLTSITSVNELSELGQEFLFQLARLPQLLPHPVIDINLKGEITYINSAATQQFANIQHAQLDHPILAGILENVPNNQGTLFVREVKIGQEVFEQYLHYLALDKIIRSYIFNFTQRKQIEVALWESEERYSAVVRQISEGIVLVETDDKKIIEANVAFSNLLGYSLEEILELTLYDVVTLDREIIDSELERILTNKLDLVIESICRRKDGSLVDVEVSVSLIHYGEKEVLCFAVRDITERKRSQEMLQYHAFHDLLTELPNRILFNKYLTTALANAKRDCHLMAVLFLDLDRFKNINDTLGHVIGDKLLQAFAKRIKSCLRAGDTVARWGGDEFVILLPHVSEVRDAAKLGERILSSLKQPFELDQHTLYAKSSIGIVIYPQDGRDAEILIKHADAALYRTKKQGRNQYQFYSPSMSLMTSTLLRLEYHLYQALENQELSVYYLPQVDLNTGKIYGMEALLRWHHLELGEVPPAKFLPIAEETNLIIPMGEWVLQTACAQNQFWQEAGFSVQVAVNLSSRQLQQSNLPATVAQILAQNSLAPQWLELEITETAIAQDINSARKALDEFQKIGVGVSLDDFGVGYSSFNYLKQFSFRTLKIAQSFVRELQDTPQDRAIVSAVVTLGRGFDIRVVAEGVETLEQKQLLQSLQCEKMQGYWFSQPLNAQEATQLLVRPLLFDKSVEDLQP